MIYNKFKYNQYKYNINTINFLIQDKIIVHILQEYRLNYRQDCDFEINRATSRETTNYRKSSTDNQ